MKKIIILFMSIIITQANTAFSQEGECTHYDIQTDRNEFVSITFPDKATPKFKIPDKCVHLSLNPGNYLNLPSSNYLIKELDQLLM